MPASTHQQVIGPPWTWSSPTEPARDSTKPPEQQPAIDDRRLEPRPSSGAAPGGEDRAPIAMDSTTASHAAQEVRDTGDRHPGAGRRGDPRQHHERGPASRRRARADRGANATPSIARPASPTRRRRCRPSRPDQGVDLLAPYQRAGRSGSSAAPALARPVIILELINNVAKQHGGGVGVASGVVPSAGADATEAARSAYLEMQESNDVR